MDNQDLEKLQNLIKAFIEPLAEDAIKRASGSSNTNLCGLNSAQGFKAPDCDIQSPATNDPEKDNEFRSASVLLKEISDEAIAWQRSLPENYRAAVLAVLHGGMQIQVESLSQISFHGIRVAGTLNGSPCSVLAHQSTIQLLCYGEAITDEAPRNPIGFIWDGRKIEV